MPGQAAVRDEDIYQDFGGDQELQGLNATILNGLSRKIRVGAKYTEDDMKKQKIKTHYKRACYMDYLAGNGNF